MRKQFSRSIAVFILFFLSPLFTNATARAAVVINELMPIDSTSGSEWVELYNTDAGLDSTPLQGWKLQNSEGSYFDLPNANIAPHGFLLFYNSQMNMNFSKQGDTVQLFDENGNLVDSESYPSILGYDNSMGRSTDGGGTWSLCKSGTKNASNANQCPAPSPTPTPTPTSTPSPTPMISLTDTPTPTPLPTSIPTPILSSTPARQTFGSFLPSPAQTQVLGAEKTPSPTPTPDQTRLTLKIDKILAFQILAVAIAWGSIAIVAFVRQKKKR